MHCGKDKQIHQLNKLCDETLERNDIFPITVTDAVFDKQTGNSLKSILLQNNNIFLPFKGSAAATRISLPVALRRKGIIISYVNMDNETITEKLINDDDISDAFIALDANWKKITLESVVNYPDEEDITAINDKLKFKDKEYVSDSYLGLGRKYLRLNIVDTKNVLTQDMINEENTIYHIQYDYDLNGQEITIPDNCVLEFEGGSITNGILKGNILNNYIKPEWFGAKGDGVTNDSLAFQLAIDLCNYSNTCKTVKLDQKHYLINNIKLYSYITLEGSDKYQTILSSYNKFTNVPLITTGIEQGQNITIKNLCIESEGARTEYTVKIINKLGVTIDNCYIVRHNIEAVNNYHGIFIGRDSTTPNATIYVPKFTNNRVNQCSVTIEGTDGYIDHNELWGIGCEYALHLVKSGNHMISNNQIVGGSVYGAIYCTKWATALKLFGNYFDGSSTVVANVPYGLNVDCNLTYSIISNNNFWHVYGIAIRVKTSIGNTFNGNVFENNDTSDAGNPDIVLENTQSGSITNNSFIRANVTRENKAPILNITGFTGSDYEPIIINGNTIRGYRNYTNAIYTPKDSTIKSTNNNSSLFEFNTNVSLYKTFNPYGELNYNSNETIKTSPLDAKVFTYIETNRKIRLDNLNYLDSTFLTGDAKFDFNRIYNKDFNLYINNYNSVINPPNWITGGMWLENRYLTTNYSRQIIYSGDNNPIYSRVCINSVWSPWINSDGTLISKVVITTKKADFVYNNKTYRIVSDIDLGTAELVIPSNCTLDFQGGSISNGTIIFNNTKLKGEIKINTNVSGTINNNEINVLWFNVFGNGNADDRTSIQQIFNIAKENSTIIFPKTSNYYKVIIGEGTGDTIVDQRADAIVNNTLYPIVISKKGITIIIEGIIKSTNILGNVFELNADNIYIKGDGKIKGPGGADDIGFLDTNTSDTTLQWHPSLVKVIGNYCKINNISFEDYPTHGIDCNGTNLIVDSCLFIGGRIEHSTTGGTVLMGIRTNVGANSAIITKNRFIANSLGGKCYSCVFPSGDSFIMSNNICEKYHEHAVYAYGNYGSILDNKFTDVDCIASDIQYFATYGIIKGNISIGTEGFIQLMHGKGTIIEGNTVTNCRGGIIVRPYHTVDVDKLPSGLKVVNNFIELTVGTTGSCFNFYIVGTYDISDILIEGNTFANGYYDQTSQIKASLAIVAGSSENNGIKFLRVSNNVIKSGRGAVSYLKGIHNSLFKNNKFISEALTGVSSSFSSAINANYVTNTIFEGNEFIDTKETATLARIIQLNTGSTNLTVKDNNIINYTSNIYLDYDTEAKLIYKIGNRLNYLPLNSTTENRPNAYDKEKGFNYFDTTLLKPMWWSGVAWRDADGYPINKKVGTTSERPHLAAAFAGFQYFDTTLGKYICWSGTAWINLDGTALV